MALNESLLKLHKCIQTLKSEDSKENISYELSNSLEYLKDTIRDFLKQWEDIDCNDLNECLNKLFEEGYLQVIDRENVQNMINILNEKDADFEKILSLYINSIENIFETIYFEYRFG